MKLNNRFEVRLRYQSFHPKAFDRLKEKIQSLLKVGFSSIRLPVKKKRITLLKSPHVNKKARDQYEMRLYNGLILLYVDSLNFAEIDLIRKLFLPNISLKVSISTYYSKMS